MPEIYRKTPALDKTQIISSQEFKDSVQYERTRSDRFSTVFSVIVINFGNSDQDALEHFTDEIQKKKRSIDCVGWDRHGAISILLPDTDIDGSKSFWEKLNLHSLDQNEGFSCYCYTYPDHWLENPRQNEDIEAILSKVRPLDKSSVESLFVLKTPLWKRSFDIIVSALLILLISPILIFVGVFIKIVSPGPVFFHQSRIGYRGIPFKFWKFRTMKHGNNQQFHGKHSQSFIKDGDVPMEKLDECDPRIIPGGRILRVSCIDELPQLWNVLSGDMSLVGPRPCIPYEAEEYLRWHTHRFDTVPGMTGLWQVSGKNRLTFKEMIRLDIGYCSSISFFRDISILMKTPVVVVQLVVESIKQKFVKKND